ncbi:MAG: hypothetical protein AAFV53_21235 [Myxococcota bacterium]
MRIPDLITTLTLVAVLAACNSESDKGSDSASADTSAGDTTGSDTDTSGSDTDTSDSDAIELSPELCDDPSNLEAVTDAMADGAGSGEGGLGMNEDELQKLLANPTERFYMVNLIKYRERAEYADGRETELTGREANALYDPMPFITAMGGRIVYNSTVDQQIDGTDDVIWDDVAIVEYPCPIGFLAMATSPEFQETSIHKDAGVETTRVMFTELQPSAAPSDPDQSEAMYPPTEADPAFDRMHVMDFHDLARYEEGVDEPERTGAEAWNLYQASSDDASAELGHYTTASLKVNGTLIGESTGWDEIMIVHMSSMEGFQALLDEEARSEGRYHLDAALADNDSMIMYPMISNIPYADDSGSGEPLEVTPNGTGTICQDDSDCPDDSFICLSEGDEAGFCTPQGCEAGSCEGSYLCCHDCNPAFEEQLPFEKSACFPDDAISGLTNEPVSCTCD